MPAVSVFFKTFPRRGKCFKQMKIASTTGEMFYITYFLFLTSNICQLCYKNSFLHLESLSNQLFFQFKAGFFLIRPNIGNKCSKNSLLFFLKHLHDGGFNFHLMNAQFYAGKMISIDFAYTIHLLQIAIEEEEVDNGCDG